jgi:hypothetical protein
MGICVFCGVKLEINSTPPGDVGTSVAVYSGVNVIVKVSVGVSVTVETGTMGVLVGVFVAASNCKGYRNTSSNSSLRNIDLSSLFNFK